MPAHKQPARSQAARRGTGLLVRGVHLVHGLVAAAVLTALVAGTPWGLVRYIGWPLPGRLPTWPEIEAVLLAPMSTSFLLNTLACILWPVWSAFVYDVVRATVDEVRAFPRPAISHAGPLNAVATVLVGTVIVALFAQRPTAPATSAPAAAATSTSTTTPNPTLVPARLVAFTQPAAGQIHGHSRTTGTVEVEPPHDGIYDSLWLIADRALGDGNRWPEIYALNRGHPQPDGRSLTTPNLIRPGWILRLPGDSSSPGTKEPGQRDPAGPRPESPRPPQTGAPTTPTPSPNTSPPTKTPTSPSLPAHNPHHRPGVGLPTGAFVGIGFAALIAAALLTVRRRRRVRYRPGSGERDDLTIAPVVRALRVAYDDATRADADGPDDNDLPVQPGPALAQAPRTPSENSAPAASPPTDERVIGVKDGQALAWNIARARGLGVIGPGAVDAIRALLVALVAEPRQSSTCAVEIVIPAADARTLIGEPTGFPTRLRVVDDLDAALDTMEAELLTRTGTDPDATHGTRPFAGDLLVLVATPAPHADRRLQAVLDNGSTFGLASILIGQWRPGDTVRIRPDGAVAATSPSVADTLAGARLFTLPATDAQALLGLLHDAEPARQPRAQRPPATSLPASDLRDLGTEAPAPRPTSTRTRRRLAHGPAPHPTDEPSLTSDDPRHPADPDDVQRDGAPHVPRDDGPTPTDVAAQARDVRFAASDHLPPSAPTEPSPPSVGEGRRTTDRDTRAQRPLQLAVLGRMRLTHHQTGGDEHADLSPTLAPKQREVLAYLALHRDGVRREVLTTALWPDAPRDRPYNSFHATLSQLRRALRAATHDALSDVTVHADGHYGLDRDQIAVDLWELQDTLEASRHDTNEQYHRTALERAVELYVGDFAADLTAEWIEAHREAIRRDVLDAVSALVRILRDEPEQALALLERARTLDRYNEAIYRDIARFQAQLGQYDAIPRTLALLTTTLDEIDDEPSRETVALCDFLQRPRSTKRTTRGREAS
ncbi:hypothetical protein [Streptomyces fulvoviolaceus]|uniref:hypothetical protein n=1 Tax=Streptomyces fulvoviolaceus TaxID=285535 RepID=UPI0021BE6F1D|nr:hypothetical protein [Streptomyces fulvoviolaceus]MCT9080469.1 hypothetical protein [Streptomyces fulvoviolaceus]